MRGLAAGLMLLLLAAMPVRAQERVTFASAEPGGVPTLTAYLYKPAGNGPFPAMVLHHGCGGMYSRRGEPSPIIAAWAQRFVAAGMVALAVDSFGSRGYTEMCTRATPQPVRPALERTRDAFAALRYLRSRDDVRADRIGLIGWSHGGSTVLWSASRQASAQRAAAGPGPDFRAAIAFYPGCGAPLANRRYEAVVPLLVLVGEADDWTRAPPCTALAEAQHHKGAALELVLYPGAHHGFDAPGSRHLTRTDTAVARAKGGVVTLATDPDARADAIVRVAQFLEERLLQ